MHRSLDERVFISAFIIITIFINIISLGKFYLHSEKYWARPHSFPPPLSKKKKHHE